ncbi:hypothetical protein [Chamaesiphon sp. GL140_3_metabinner_50]|uniref:hypothetical protein n=1 Tax=Chamaesiphon sp. GL140_3_metabinner_50 TaxID=2970812 RepID=UPI0025FA8022|nr:hypothetical protein [Chamaesiphon sp. GL140_3_metabinner_50]
MTFKPHHFCPTPVEQSGSVIEIGSKVDGDSAISSKRAVKRDNYSSHNILQIDLTSSFDRSR